MSEQFDVESFYQTLSAHGVQIQPSDEEEVRAFPATYPVARSQPTEDHVGVEGGPESSRGGESLIIPAVNFTRGRGIEVSRIGYGDVIHNSRPYKAKANRAEWDFMVESTGKYLLRVEYAAAESRPCSISLLVAGPVKTNALAKATGGWHLANQAFVDISEVYLKAGEERLVIERSDVFPHIRTVAFVPL